MSVRSGQSVTTTFVTSRFSTGVATNADSTPTGVLYVNGTADAASVTVTNITTGLYKAAVTLPTLAVGDVVNIVISATVDSVAGKGKVWEDTKDVFAGAIPDVAAGGTGGLFIAGSNAATTISGLTTGAISATTITASGAVAFQSTLAITGATTFTGNVGMAAGLSITQSSSNASALVVTGNGTGSGAVFTSGSGATGDGFKAIAASTNGNGIVATGTGTESGLRMNGGTTGPAAFMSGGAYGLQITSLGGPGVLINPTDGNGITIAANGTSKHGLSITGGTAGTSDGILIAAGTGGVGLRLDTLTSSGTITANALTVSNAFTVSGATTLTGAVTASNASNNIVGIDVAKISGDATAADNLELFFDGTGYNAANSTVGTVTLVTTVTTVTGLTASNLDVAVSSRMASYTQPTGFLTATFPTTVASTTNITAGTITTVTNLTNAPTSGDLTATMKTSILTTVWDSAISGHTTSGTFGGALNSASSAGDPWNTALPGAYAAGTAGYIMGTNLNATISSRSTYAGGAVASVTAGVTVATGGITPASVSAALPANITYVNSILIDGSGTSADPWGPA